MGYFTSRDRANRASIGSTVEGMNHIVYESTKLKMRQERRVRARRAGLVVGATVATAALGLLYPDSTSTWGALRISVLGGMGAFAALVLTR